MRDERNTESELLDASNPVSRRHFVGAGVAAAALTAHGRLERATSTSSSREITHSEAAMAQVPAFELEEATVGDLQARMKDGRNTSASLVQLYLQRIDAIDQRGPA